MKIISAFWGGLTPMVKWLIVGSILALIMIALAVFIWMRESSFEDREREREAERKALVEERDALIKERDAAKLLAAEAEAKADALSVVATEKKSNADQVVAELREIEREHEQRKAELEAQGQTLSDDALRRELCLELKRAGYRVTCTE
jgi:biopolymer transport protein ExbB/TolQ